jgi:hypothetical protein
MDNYLEVRDVAEKLQGYINQMRVIDDEVELENLETCALNLVCRISSMRQKEIDESRKAQNRRKLWKKLL